MTNNPGTEKPFDPVEGFSTLGDNLRRAISEGVRNVTSANYPALDVYRDGDRIVVKTTPLDGIDVTTIDVSMAGPELTISGTTRNASDIPAESYLRRERSFGQFSRTITIPVRVQANAAQAKVKNSVLTVTFPVEPPGDDDVIDIHVTD